MSSKLRVLVRLASSKISTVWRTRVSSVEEGVEDCAILKVPIWLGFREIWIEWRVLGFLGEVEVWEKPRGHALEI